MFVLIQVSPSGSICVRIECKLKFKVPRKVFPFDTVVEKEKEIELESLMHKRMNDDENKANKLSSRCSSSRPSVSAEKCPKKCDEGTFRKF